MTAARPSPVRRLVQAVVQRVKRDPGYVLDPELSTRDVLSEVAHRLAALVRGQWKLLGIRGGRLRFVESRCRFQHRRHLTIGSGSVIEHGARLTCLSRDGVRIGERVTVGKFAIVECTGVLWHLASGLEVGDDSSIGDYSFLGCAGGITIGSGVLMGQRVSFHSQNHEFEDPTIPISKQGVVDEPITVGDDCWIGSGSILLAGVELGDGCVVAAGSVVTKSFPAQSVIAGVPARLLHRRGEGRETPGRPAP